jgi:hypothetical protein
MWGNVFFWFALLSSVSVCFFSFLILVWFLYRLLTGQ